MALAEYLPLKDLLFLGLFSMITSTMTFLQMLWNTIVKGPRNVFMIRRRPTRPEVLDDPSLGTHHIARLKTIKLHYVAKGSEDNPILLCIHGFPEFWYSWRYQLKDLSDKFRVIAMDMRGYSESDKPSGIANYNIDLLTADVKALIEHLGHKRVTLVAHDWGGAVAWAFATEYPDMVDKLIACNMPHPAAFRQHVRRATSQAKKSWYVSFFQMPVLPELYTGSQDLKFIDQAFTGKGWGTKSGTFSAEDIEAYKYTFQNFADRTAPINFYRASGRYKSPIPKRKVRCPTLVIWGTADAFLEKEMVEMSRSYVDAEFIVKYLEGTSHWVQQEEPEITNKYIRDFLDGKLRSEEQKE